MMMNFPTLDVLRYSLLEIYPAKIYKDDLGRIVRIERCVDDKWYYIDFNYENGDPNINPSGTTIVSTGWKLKE